MQGMLQRLTRGHDLTWILRNHGLVGTLRWLRRSLPYYLWLHCSPSGRREMAFDQLHGVETEGFVHRWEMGDVGPNKQFAIQYLPSKPRKFYQLMDSLDIQHSQFTFIGIGSGKGRVLLMAERYGFKHLVGVEFVSALHETAVRNLAVSNCEAELLCMDAANFEFPSGPLVIYMCNPFEAQLVEKFVRNLESSLSVNPRAVYVVYWNCLHAKLFSNSRHFVQLAYRRDQFAVFASSCTSVHSRPRELFSRISPNVVAK